MLWIPLCCALQVLSSVLHEPFDEGSNLSMY